MLVAHDRREIEVWSRTETAAPWTRALAITGDVVAIEAVSARLEVDAVYADAAEPR
jgi:hypothetical protein